MIADFDKTGKSPQVSPASRRFVDFILIPAIVVIVGVAAFGLGRLSALKETQTSLVIHPNGGNDQTH